MTLPFFAGVFCRFCRFLLFVAACLLELICVLLFLFLGCIFLSFRVADKYIEIGVVLIVDQVKVQND